MNLTEYQLDIMAHTVHGSNRNFFHVKHENETFDEIVSMGYATKECTEKWMGPGFIYRLTEKGKKAVKQDIRKKL